MFRFLLIAMCIAFAAAFQAPASALSMRSAAISMDEKAAPKKEKPPPKPRVPGEGDPFGPEGMAFGDANKDGKKGAFQPRAISDASVIDKFQASNYIEAYDEPWHATCQTVTSLQPDALS